MVTRDRKQKNLKVARHTRSVLEEVADTLAKRAGRDTANMSEALELALLADDEVHRLVRQIAAKYGDDEGWIETANPQINATMSSESLEIMTEFAGRLCLRRRARQNIVAALNAMFHADTDAWDVLSAMRIERSRR